MYGKSTRLSLLPSSASITLFTTGRYLWVQRAGRGTDRLGVKTKSLSPHHIHGALEKNLANLEKKMFEKSKQITKFREGAPPCVRNIVARSKYSVDDTDNSARRQTDSGAPGHIIGVLVGGGAGGLLLLGPGAWVGAAEGMETLESRGSQVN